MTNSSKIDVQIIQFNKSPEKTQRTLRTRNPASENAQEEIVDQAIRTKAPPPKKQKVATRSYQPTLVEKASISSVDVLCLLAGLRCPLRALLYHYKKLPKGQRNDCRKVQRT